jgi:hypothetical protein
MRRVFAVLSVLSTLLFFMLQVGPEDAVMNAGKWYRLIPVALFSPPTRTAASFAFGAMALASFLAWLFVARHFESELIPLREAAGLVLSRTKKTGFGGWIFGSSEQETVYGVFCELLHQDVPVRGRQAPGKTFDRVRFDANREALVGMTSIQPHHADIRVTDLCVRRGDLTKFVKVMEAKDRDSVSSERT